MTTRKPKPVRAWALVIPSGKLSVLCGQVEVFTTRKVAKFECELGGEDLRPIRVTILPDGTPSQAAEVRRLRRALRAIRDPRVVWGLPEARSIADAALRGRRGR